MKYIVRKEMMSLKGCPRCKAIAFDDMNTCFNCMYRFDLENSGGSLIPLVMDDLEEAELPVHRGIPSAPDIRRDSACGQSSARGQNPAGGQGSVCVAIEEKDPVTGSMRRRDVTVLDGQSLVIGRSKSSDVILSAPTASRVHARLSSEDGRIYLEDLSSSNHTYVNGVRIREKTVISSYDRVRIGSALLHLKTATCEQPN